MVSLEFFIIIPAALWPLTEMNKGKAKGKGHPTTGNEGTEGE
jgi:hypothetical protein